MLNRDYPTKNQNNTFPNPQNIAKYIIQHHSQNFLVLSLN